MDATNPQAKAQAKVWSAAGAVSTREIDLAPFGTGLRRRLLKSAVVHYQANQRQGTHSTKTRSETSYSGAKPWPQKHTGRARAGDRNSPLWRKGGRIHGPRPRDYRQHLPVRALREALRSALLGKFRDGEVAFVESLALEKPSTKRAAQCLMDLGAQKGATIVLPADSGALYRSFRNLVKVEAILATEVNALHVLRRKVVVFVGDAFATVEKRLGPPAAPASADRD